MASYQTTGTYPALPVDIIHHDDYPTIRTKEDGGFHSQQEQQRQKDNRGLSLTSSHLGIGTEYLPLVKHPKLQIRSLEFRSSHI